MGLRHHWTFEMRGLLLTVLPMLQLLAANQRDHQGQAGKQTLLQAQWRYMQVAEALASHAAFLPHSDYSFMTLLGEVLQSACQLFYKIKLNKNNELNILSRDKAQHPARCLRVGRAKCTIANGRIDGSKTETALPKWQDGMKTPSGRPCRKTCRYLHDLAFYRSE